MATAAELKEKLDKHYSGDKYLSSSALLSIENELFEMVENYLLTYGTHLEYMVRPPITNFFNNPYFFNK